MKNVALEGRDLATAVLDCLSRHGIDFVNCRRQTHNKATNMSGIFTGMMQAAVHEENSVAEYIRILCAHSLNLVRQGAALSYNAASTVLILCSKCVDFYVMLLLKDI